MESPGKNQFFKFGGKKKEVQSDDEDFDSDNRPKKSKRGGKKVGFARDDSELFKTTKSKNALKKTKNRARGHSVDSYAPSDSEKPSMMKKFGVMFKSNSKDDGETGRGRSMKRNTSRDSDLDYGKNNYANMKHAASFPAHHGNGFALDTIGTASTRSAPQLPPEFPAVANLSALPMMHAPGERARYSVYHGSGGFTGAAKPVKRKFRVRPYHCFDEPVNMTEEEIYKDSLKPSKKFEHLTTYIKPPSKVNRGLKVPDATKKVWGTPEKDGRLGSLKIELLGCIGLARPKPDVCVYFVCADMAFCTDVVTSYRSPMWPCASRRGAVLPINHAYAQLYVGVFDCKSRKNKENDVFCGRVVIDIASLRPETEYDVTFPLRHSTFIYDRRPRGVIRLRFGLHWFNERAAVISYFKNPKSIVTTSPLIQGQPTVPCADPKTFRNVAVTCHGIDLPGKYTRGAFRATMREFNLYQLNIRQVAKVMTLDAILYERPLVSFYMFFAGMHCIIASSARLVPPYWVGFLLIQLMLNHQYFVQSDGYNLGYKPVSLWQIGKALLYRTDRDFPCLEPAFIAKRTKQRKNKEKATKKDGKDGDEQITEYDHREFPFSERDTYAKFAVEDALAPSTNSKARRESTTRLHGRLSVYYSAAPPTQAEAPAAGEEEEEESSDDSEGDEETVMGDGMAGDTGLYGLDDEPQDEDEELQGRSKDVEMDVIAPKTGLFERDPNKKRLKVGPPQDTDTKGKTKTPPQVHLKKVETRLHRVSLGLSVELIHPPPSYDQPEKTEANLGSSAARKQIMDDFDKLLGLNERSANPINRIASSFLGPLMRMIRIAIYFVRIAFHLATWRDPYLTFWLFTFLSVLCIVLIMFPWRTFLLVLTIALVGPQNLFVRVYLAKKALKKKQKQEEEKAAKLKKEREEADVGLGYAVDYGYGDAAPVVAIPDERHFELPKEDTQKKTGLGFWQKKFGVRDAKDDEDDVAEMKKDRPVFSSTVQGTVTSRKIQPRSVAVPYSRFKKDRFFDWPPDPTVSRATPLIPWVVDTPQDTTKPNEPATEMIMAAAEKRAQRAELRRRIAAANRKQVYASEN